MYSVRVCVCVCVCVHVCRCVNTCRNLKMSVANVKWENIKQIQGDQHYVHFLKMVCFCFFVLMAYQPLWVI